LSIRYYLKEACLNLAQGVPDVHAHTLYRQGYHVIDPGTGESSKEYIVCGKDIFYIERPSENETKFIQLEGPRHGNVLFDIGLTSIGRDTEKWYPYDLDVDVLNNARSVDLKDTYNTLITFFKEGFNFKSQEVTCEFLAAQTMLFPIMSAFKRQMALSITGETSSGKSSLLSVFVGIFYPELQLIYCSQGMDNYTYASIAGMTNGCSKLLGLDEYEYDGPKGETVKSVNELTRGVITGDSGKRTISQKDGQGIIAQSHKFSMITCGITAAERPQDLNRLIIIEMEKRAGRDSVQAMLFKKLGADKIKQLAKDLTFCMFHHVPEIQKRREKIATEYETLVGDLPFAVEWRYASALFTVMALLNYLGLDEKAFFRRFMLANEAIIHRATSINESSQLLNTMFNYGTLYQPDTKRNTSVGALLNQSSTREDVNTHACGVYFDEKTRCILLLLSQAIPELIPSKNNMCNAPESRIKSVLERHKNAISPEQIEASGIIKRAATYMGSNITVDDVVAFSADPWLSDPQRNPEIETPKTPPATPESTPQESVKASGSTVDISDTEEPAEEPSEEFTDW
jgi:energy-coupling factor transporter ATP-binding protein EcfA2